MVSGLPVVQSSRKVQALPVPQVKIGHSHLLEMTAPMVSVLFFALT